MVAPCTGRRRCDVPRREIVKKVLEVIWNNWYNSLEQLSLVFLNYEQLVEAVECFKEIEQDLRELQQARPRCAALAVIPFDNADISVPPTYIAKTRVTVSGPLFRRPKQRSISLRRWRPKQWNRNPATVFVPDESTCKPLVSAPSIYRSATRAKKKESGGKQSSTHDVQSSITATLGT